ncbi:hypothetical protein BDR05DRAFT_92213 [Suillus weaverae]|nr:hypothetical protein BDR05DRAFT_92213 [Suillus weaverae]
MRYFHSASAGITKVAAFAIGPAIRGGAITDLRLLRSDDTQVLVLVPCYVRGNIPLAFLLQVPSLFYLSLVTKERQHTNRTTSCVTPRFHNWTRVNLSNEFGRRVIHMLLVISSEFKQAFIARANGSRGK